VAGLNAFETTFSDADRLKTLAARLNSPLGEIEAKIDALLTQQKALEKNLKAAAQREAAGKAKELLATAETIHSIPAIVAHLGQADGDTLQTIVDSLKSFGFTGVVVVGGVSNGTVALVASVSAEWTARIQAGKIIQAIAPVVGGKGGGRPDGARGGGKDPAQLDAALTKARELLV